jgi:multiple sugar transport system permease protein
VYDAGGDPPPASCFAIDPKGVSSVKVRTKERVTNGSIYLVMVAVSVTTLLPFAWMLSTSLKLKSEAQVFPPKWIPDPLAFDAYVDVWAVSPLLSGIKNSLLIAGPVILCGTFVSALAAFAFSKMEFPHKDKLFMGLLATMMIPGVVTMIPQYVAWGSVGLTDTLVPLIVPGLLGNTAMMFFLRQFLNGVPNEILEAAQIDGVSWFGMFMRIIFPILRPAIAAQVIFWFMGIWNDFLGPLIYLDSESNYTVQLALRLLSSMSESTSEFPIIMAGAVISCLPLLILFVSFQRFFMDTMVIAGVKG